MKVKALAIILAIFVAGTAFALESGPSNPVGFFTVNISRAAGVNSYNLVSFPTLPANDSLTQTIGNQLPSAVSPANRTAISWLVNYGTGVGTYATATKLNDGGIGWTSSTVPTLLRLESRKGYYILLKNNGGLNALSYNVVIAGNVRTANWNMDSIVFGYNMVGSVFAASVPLASTNLLLPAGVRLQRGNSPLFVQHNDRVSALQSANMTNPGAFITAVVTSTYTWSSSSSPTLTTLDPGRGYFVLRDPAGTQPRSNFLWPDYPVPANTSSSDAYRPAVSQKPVASTTPAVSLDNAPRNNKPVVTTPAASIAPSVSNDAITTPAKAKPTTAKSK